MATFACIGTRDSVRGNHEDHCGGRDEKAECGGWGRFVVAGQPAKATNPTERPLDHPQPRLNGKALLPGFHLSDLGHDSRGRSEAPASVGAVIKTGCHEGEEPARDTQQGGAAVAVVQVDGGAVPATSGLPAAAP